MFYYNESHENVTVQFYWKTKLAIQMFVQLHSYAAVDHVDFHLSSSSSSSSPGEHTSLECEHLSWNKCTWPNLSFPMTTLTKSHKHGEQAERVGLCVPIRVRGITAAGRGDPLRACRLPLLIRSMVPVCTKAGSPSL